MANITLISLLALAGQIPNLVYAIPLILVISIVHGATRHEHSKEIFYHTYRSLVWVICFMGIIMAIIWVSGFFN